MFHFDWTISLGNVITAVTFLILALLAWKDVTWRVKNLEIWRTEHMVDADSRDNLLKKLDKMCDHLEFLVKQYPRWDGSERRHK